METTYTVKSKLDGYIWQFKYHLNGNLKSFEILEGELSGKQMKWLFSPNFPALEVIMKTTWMQSLKKNFEITIGTPDLSFEAFMKIYNLNVKKVVAKRAWERLSKKDCIEAMEGVKPYTNAIQRKGVAKAHPSTYLNQRYWEDNWASIH